MEEQNKTSYNDSVHWVLSHGYAMYFILFLLGVGLDSAHHLAFFQSAFLRPLGVFFLVVATLLIFWAQHTSRYLPQENITMETFCRGPYCYTRSPTHWGLFLLVLGFGFVANAFFVVISTILSMILSKFVFLRKEEALLAKKYGAPYLEYKKKIKI